MKIARVRQQSPEKSMSNVLLMNRTKFDAGKTKILRVAYDLRALAKLNLSLDTYYMGYKKMKTRKNWYAKQQRINGLHVGYAQAMMEWNKL